MPPHAQAHTNDGPAAGQTVEFTTEPTAANAGPVNANVPGYEILAELGRGGMGVVYKAHQISLRRVVALKMILSGGHASGADLNRFRTEAESIARLQHPNIVQIHEIGEHAGLPYFSLEFCDGGSLEKKLAGTPLPPNGAAALVEKLARAMQAAHDKGVIHRDLKPANILLSENGTPKITDFGLAKKLDEAGRTQAGTIMGTPSYMAPEQAGGSTTELGPACDIYALGALLYECLTGRPPFRAATPLDTVMQVVNDEPVPPTQLNANCPRDLETICLKCLQKDPAKRYQSASGLADELQRFQAGEPILARPAGSLERTMKWVKRRPGVAGLMAAVLLVGLIGFTGVSAALVWALNERDHAIVQEDKAKKLAQDNKKLADDATKANEEQKLLTLQARFERAYTQTTDDPMLAVVGLAHLLPDAARLKEKALFDSISLHLNGWDLGANRLRSLGFHDEEVNHVLLMPTAPWQSLAVRRHNFGTQRAGNRLANPCSTGRANGGIPR